MKFLLITFLYLFMTATAMADLKYHPISFALTTDKESYYEGEKITIFVTITNTDNEKTFPVLVPNTQNTGQKLLYLNLYDKANNSLLLRATEDRMFSKLVKDTGSVQIKYLKPLEHITIPIYLYGMTNHSLGQTQDNQHHDFGIPIFAGIYKLNIAYNPKGILLGNSIYTYYSDFNKSIPYTDKLMMTENVQISHMIDLKIKRSADSIVTIDQRKYYVKTNGHYFFYFSEPMQEIITDQRCIHISNLPADSCAIRKGEYFYSHFTDLFAEYITRFDDGDIREYRKFTDGCPGYLYTEEYNDLKQKIRYAIQLPDKQFYSITYTQPGDRIAEESYCDSAGTFCKVTTYVYDKKGGLLKTKTSKTEPCVEFLLEDESNIYYKGIIKIKGK